MITLLLLAITGFFLATRSFVLEAIARPQIEATLGGEVQMGRIRWLSFDQLEVRDLVGQAPGWSGPAGEVIRIDRAVLDIDSAALRTGRFNINAVEVEGMRVRFAERNEEPGVFNFASLRPVAGEGSLGVPPRKIKVLDFLMEMGSSSDGKWTRTGTVDFSGTMDADQEDPRTLYFQFVTGSMAASKAVMKGAFNTEGLTFNGAITDLEINRNLIGMLPMELREATASMNLEGKVERITASWDGEDSVAASIDLGNAEMTVPENLESSWSRLSAGLVTPVTSPPLMQISSGTLELFDNTIKLTRFVGRMSDQEEGADSIPVEIGFEMNLTKALDEIREWDNPQNALENAFELSPFTLRIDVPNFEIDPSRNGVVLPSAAAKAFSEFGIESWVVNVAVEMTRSVPGLSESNELIPAELLTNGTVKVQDGAGQYSRFPYPLQDVKALIKFSDELVEIEHLVGRGPNGGSVVVKGSITKPGPAAGIMVNIKGSDVPGDKVFRSALDGWRRRIWDRFFDKHAENRMSSAGLLNTEADVEEASEQRERLYQRLDLLSDEPEGSKEKIIQEIARLDRIIEAGPFRMGGIFSFDLTVSSEEGEGKPVFLTGDIDILEGDVLISDFPFPMHLLNSRITLEADDILLNSGLTFTTPYGGNGIIRGSIHNPDTEEGQDPQAFIDVEFAARDVTISPQLLAALPPSDSDAPTDPGDWPGRWQSQAARAMAALGLEGTIDLDGALRGDENDLSSDPILTFRAKLTEATITPDAGMSDFFAELGFVWPTDFQLRNCHAAIEFDTERVGMSSFHGERGDGMVDARGFISRQDDSAGLEVSFSGIEMEDYLLDLIPSGPRSRARSLWDTFKPRGTFDAALNWNQNASGVSDSLVTVEPDSITLELEGEDVDLHRSSGRVYIRPTIITAERLEMEFRNSRMIHGNVSLNGSYGEQSDGKGLTLEGRVDGGRFSSPVVPVILQLVGAERVRETWIELEPSGAFECSFEYRSLEDDELDYMVDITPRNLSATLENGQIHANFSDGALFISPGQIDLEHLEASIPGPGVMRVEGVVRTEDWIDVDASLEYDFDSFLPSNLAYFPPPLSNGFKAVEFESEGPLKSNLMSISGRWHPEESIELPRRYESAGEIVFESASLTAASRLEEFDGRCSINSSSSMDDDLTSLITILDGRLEGESLKIQDRLLANPSTHLSIDGSNIFRAGDISGEIAGGRMLGDLQIDLESLKWLLSMDLEDARLEELTKASDAEVASGTQGDLRASFNVTGTIDQPETKFGRGRIVIQNGRMTDSPLTLSILQLSQLMLPISDSFEFGEIDFSIEADRLRLDELELTSPTIEFTGKGEMSLDSWELAVRLFPKGTIPLVSDLISGVTGTLYAINIKGTLDEPVASVEPLPLLGDPARIDQSSMPEDSKLESRDQDTGSE